MCRRSERVFALTTFCSTFRQHAIFCSATIGKSAQYVILGLSVPRNQVSFYSDDSGFIYNGKVSNAIIKILENLNLKHHKYFETGK